MSCVWCSGLICISPMSLRPPGNETAESSPPRPRAAPPQSFLSPVTHILPHFSPFLARLFPSRNTFLKIASSFKALWGSQHNGAGGTEFPARWPAGLWVLQSGLRQVQSHKYSPGGLNTPSCLQAVSLGHLLGVGTASGTHISRTGEGERDAPCWGPAHGSAGGHILYSPLSGTVCGFTQKCTDIHPPLQCHCPNKNALRTACSNTLTFSLEPFPGCASASALPKAQSWFPTRAPGSPVFWFICDFQQLAEAACLSRGAGEQGASAVSAGEGSSWPHRRWPPCFVLRQTEGETALLPSFIIIFVKFQN